MTKLVPILGVLAMLVSPIAASAQNAGHIASAKRGANCPGCNLFQADFSGMEVSGRSYAGSRLRQADLSLSVMNRTNFGHTDMRDVNAYGGVFSSSNFAGADLTHASFVGSFLEGANLSGARLDGTNFSGAELGRARGLTQGQLDRACGDGQTELPRGLRIPRC